MSSKFRLFDNNECVREDTTWGIGHEISPVGLIVNSTWILTEVTRLLTKAKYKEYLQFSHIKVPVGTPMSKWKQLPEIAESLGCTFYYEKYSKDQRYRIELEMNLEGV